VLRTCFGPSPGSCRTKRPNSPAFGNLYKRFKNALEDAKLADHYPLTAKDKGRRALLDYLRRLRKRALDIGTRVSNAADRALLRLADLFPLQPFESLQFDAHKTDVNWIIPIPVPDGGVVYRRISKIWFLSVIDVGSLAIVGWILVIGPNYSQYDVLRLIGVCMRLGAAKSSLFATFIIAPMPGCRRRWMMCARFCVACSCPPTTTRGTSQACARGHR